MSGPREDTLSHWLAVLILSTALCNPALAQQQPPQRLSLNFVNTDIEAVARAMADFTGRTIIVDPRVKGAVTLTVDQPVSAEQALATLSSALRMQNIAVSTRAASSASSPRPMRGCRAARCRAARPRPRAATRSSPRCFA